MRFRSISIWEVDKPLLRDRAVPIYIKEEASPQTHFNVYMEGDRWDIVPVGRYMIC